MLYACESDYESWSGVGNLFGSGSHETLIFVIVFPWEPYNIFQHLMQLTR